MGVCVFVASGLNFDVDGYLKNCPFKPSAVFRKGSVPAKETVPRPDSGFVVLVAEGSGLDMAAQAKAALAFLSSREREFEVMRKQGVDNLLFDFGFERSNKIQDSHYLPPELIGILGRLGMGVIFSTVQFPSG